MNTNTLVGILLILVGLADLVLGLLVIGPRVEPEKKKMVTGLFLGGSLITLLAGFAFLARIIALPQTDPSPPSLSLPAEVEQMDPSPPERESGR